MGIRIPVWEITEPNSVSEVSVAITLLQTTQRHFQLPILSVSANAEYDSDKILNCIIHGLGAKPFIPYNPRNAQDQRGFRRDGLAVYCPAQLPLHRHGRMTVKGISDVQYPANVGLVGYASAISRQGVPRPQGQQIH
jgi:hypothetical protein